MFLPMQCFDYFWPVIPSVLCMIAIGFVLVKCSAGDISAQQHITLGQMKFTQGCSFSCIQKEVDISSSEKEKSTLKAHITDQQNPFLSKMKVKIINDPHFSTIPHSRSTDSRHLELARKLYGEGYLFSKLSVTILGLPAGSLL